MSLPLAEAASVLSQKFLIQSPGVTGISWRASDPRLIVYVRSREEAERVPDTLMGYPVEAVVTGPIRILSSLPPAKAGRTLAGVEGSRTAVWRPIPGGVSGGSRLITAGTIATRVYDRTTGRKVMLSNRHVFWGDRGVEVVQPGPIDGGVETVGHILRWAPIGPPPDSYLADAALAVPISDSILSDEVLDIGIITAAEEAREGGRVKKSGRTCGVMEGTVSDIHASIRVEGYPWGDTIFEDQVMSTKLLEPGDSGSIIVSAETRAAVGLGFAGSETVSCFNKIGNVLRLLDVSLSPVAAPPPTPTRFSPLMPLFPVGLLLSSALLRRGR
jgi:hypothetical protein